MFAALGGNRNTTLELFVKLQFSCSMVLIADFMSLGWNSQRKAVIKMTLYTRPANETLLGGIFSLFNSLRGSLARIGSHLMERLERKYLLSLHWIFYIYLSEMPQCCWLSIKLFPSCQFLLFSRYFRPFYYSKKYWIWSVQEIESFSFLMIASSIQPWTLLVLNLYNKLKSLC